MRCGQLRIQTCVRLPTPNLRSWSGLRRRRNGRSWPSFGSSTGPSHRVWPDLGTRWVLPTGEDPSTGSVRGIGGRRRRGDRVGPGARGRAVVGSAAHGIDPETLLDPIDRVNYLRANDRSRPTSPPASSARSSPSQAGVSGDLRPERHVEHEVAIARRTTRGRAGRDIESRGRCARSSATPPASSAGRSASSTRPPSSWDPPRRERKARAEIQAGCCRRRVVSPSTFRRHVDTAVCAVDAEDETRRRARARGDRQVWVRRIENGLGELLVVDEWSVVKAMYEQVTTGPTTSSSSAERSGGTRPRPTTRRPPGPTPTGGWTEASTTAAPTPWPTSCCATTTTRPTANETPALDDEQAPERGPARDRPRTLRGENDNPCLLDGAPIPAPAGRRLAARDRPLEADGHRPGRRTPPRLRPTHLPARAPAHLRRRTRPDLPQPLVRPARMTVRLDHAGPFPHGPSDTANTGAVATTATPSRPTAAPPSTTPPPTAPRPGAPPGVSRPDPAQPLPRQRRRFYGRDHRPRNRPGSPRPVRLRARSSERRAARRLRRHPALLMAVTWRCRRSMTPPRGGQQGQSLAGRTTSSQRRPANGPVSRTFVRPA